MTAATFRAVVASVLVAALALAVLVTLLVFRPPPSLPSPDASHSAPSTAAPQTAAPTPPPLVFEDIVVIGVGQIPVGGSSRETLVLRFVESSPAAIAQGAGSLRVTIADQAGDGTKVAFTGVPSIDAPGSLGASAVLVAGNVLEITIIDSDYLNIEPITVTGLGIAASPSAAVGSIKAVAGDFTGSLSAGVAHDELRSPGTVIPRP